MNLLHNLVLLAQILSALGMIGLVLMQHGNQGATSRLPGLRQQPQHQPMHLVADGVVLLTDGDHLYRHRGEHTRAGRR